MPASCRLQWTNARYTQRDKVSDFDCHWRRVSSQLNCHHRGPSLHVVDYSSCVEGSAQIADHKYDSKPSIHTPHAGCVIQHTCSSVIRTRPACPRQQSFIHDHEPNRPGLLDESRSELDSPYPMFEITISTTKLESFC